MTNPIVDNKKKAKEITEEIINLSKGIVNNKLEIAKRLKIVEKEEYWKDLDYNDFDGYLDHFKQWSKSYANRLIIDLDYTAQALKIPALDIQSVDIGAVRYVRALEDTEHYKGCKELLKNGETERTIRKYYDYYKKEDLGEDAWLRHSTVWNFKDKGDIGDGLSNLPSQIIQNVLHHYTEETDLIYDPFAGSGLTKEVALSMNRRCFCSDINLNKAIDMEWDIRDGLPQQMKDADLIFLDPPYWKMVDYGEGSLDKLLFKEWLNSIEMFIASAADKLKEASVIAIIIMPIRDNGKYYDLGFELFNMIKRYFNPVQRICVPVVKEPHPLNKGQLLSTLRDLMIFEKKNIN